MFKNRTIGEEGHKGLMALKLFIRKLHISKYWRVDLHEVEGDEESNKQAMLADDVKEGHFAVFAVKTKIPKRFVVELRFLTNPAFLRLLKQAEDEYGFRQKGALVIPCQPEELQKILLDRTGKSPTAGDYNTPRKSGAINKQESVCNTLRTFLLLQFLIEYDLRRSLRLEGPANLLLCIPHKNS